jgi:hypothetical protein
MRCGRGKGTNESPSVGGAGFTLGGIGADGVGIDGSAPKAERVGPVGRSPPGRGEKPGPSEAGDAPAVNSAGVGLESAGPAEWGGMKGGCEAAESDIADFPLMCFRPIGFNRWPELVYPHISAEKCYGLK